MCVFIFDEWISEYKTFSINSSIEPKLQKDLHAKIDVIPRKNHPQEYLSIACGFI